MDVNTALSKLGRWKLWQMLALILIAMSLNCVLSLNMMIFVYIGMVPPHRCKDETNSTSVASSDSAHTVAEVQGYECFAHRNHGNGTNETTSCHNGWEYNLIHGPTIVSEWNLVCDKDYLVELSQTMFMVGLSIGNVVITALADCIGRKKAHIGAAFTAGLLGVITAFVPNYPAFVCLRFLTGISTDAIYGTGQVWLAEHFPVETRVIATSFGVYFWAVAVWILTLAAYLIQNWRYLQIFVGLASMLPIFYIWILDESIPWLTSKNKMEQAEMILSKAAKMNGVPVYEWKLNRDVIYTKVIQDQESLSDNIISEENNIDIKRKYLKLKDNNVEKNDNNLLDVLKHKSLRIYFFLIALLWLVCNISYYGIVFNIGTLAGNIYLNVLIIGVTHIAACLSISVLSQWNGRLSSMIGGLLVVGVCLLVSTFIPKMTANGTDLSILITTIVMIGLTGSTATFCTMCIYTPEIYPTPVRNLAYGFAMLFGRLGGILSPFYSYLARITYWLPAVIVAVTAIFTGIASFILPETKSRPLFQTIGEMDEWNNMKKKITSRMPKEKEQSCMNGKK